MLLSPLCTDDAVASACRPLDCPLRQSAVNCSMITWLSLSLFEPTKNSVQWSGFCGLKVYQEPKSLEDFQNYIGVMFYYSEVYMNGSKHSKTFGQGSRTRKDGDAQPLPLLMPLLNKLMPWFRPTKEWSSANYSHNSACEIIHNRLGVDSPETEKWR